AVRRLVRAPRVDEVIEELEVLGVGDREPPDHESIDPDALSGQAVGGQRVSSDVTVALGNVDVVRAEPPRREQLDRARRLLLRRASIPVAVSLEEDWIAGLRIS